jgi:CHAD domain-containing protein
VLPPAVQEELDWLGGVLGAGRDHDVLVHSTLPKLVEDANAGERLHPLVERAGSACAEKRAELRRALHSARFGQLMLTLSGWVDCCGWRAGKDRDARGSLRAPLAKFARKAVARGQDKIGRRGKKIDPHQGQSLHRLRIACKQNRYAAEFFRDIERSNRADKYIKSLAALQDVLGLRNDVAVAQRIVHELGQDSAALAAAAAFASGYLCCHATAGLGKIRKARRRFSHLPAAGLFD